MDEIQDTEEKQDDEDVIDQTEVNLIKASENERKLFTWYFVQRAGIGIVRMRNDWRNKLLQNTSNEEQKDNVEKEKVRALKYLFKCNMYLSLFFTFSVGQ